MELKDIIKEEGITVIDFFATWCGPCQMYKPIFDEVTEELRDKATFAKIDIDQNTDMAVEAEVTGVPTTAVFKDGVLIKSVNGFQSKEHLIELIQKYI